MSQFGRHWCHLIVRMRLRIMAEWRGRPPSCAKTNNCVKVNRTGRCSAGYCAKEFRRTPTPRCPMTKPIAHWITFRINKTDSKRHARPPQLSRPNSAPSGTTKNSRRCLGVNERPVVSPTLADLLADDEETLIFQSYDFDRIIKINLDEFWFIAGIMDSSTTLDRQCRNRRVQRSPTDYSTNNNSF